MRKIWKDNAKLIMAIFITIVIASGATYAATTMYDSNIVGYDNTTSGLRSTNVQSALDELYGNIAEVILNIKAIIGNSTLTTTDQTLIGAVNELDGEITNLKDIIFPSGTYQDLTFTGSGQQFNFDKPGILAVSFYNGYATLGEDHDTHVFSSGGAWNGAASPVLPSEVWAIMPEAHVPRTLWTNATIIYIRFFPAY